MFIYEKHLKSIKNNFAMFMEKNIGKALNNKYFYL